MSADGNTVRAALHLSTMDNGPYADALAALARLEAAAAERDEARKWANTMECERDWERDVVQSEMRSRIAALESAADAVLTAVKRGHEHEVDEALSDLASARDDRPFSGELDDVREPDRTVLSLLGSPREKQGTDVLAPGSQTSLSAEAQRDALAEALRQIVAMHAVDSGLRGADTARAALAEAGLE